MISAELGGASNDADIRPVIYVVNATVNKQNDDNGPDGNLQSGQDDSIYESFLASLQSSNESSVDKTASEQSTVGRWRQAHGSAEIHTPSAINIAIDVNNDTDTTTTASAADPIYSKNNSQVNFMSRRARVISVNRRHAFPPLATVSEWSNVSFRVTNGCRT